MIQEVMDEDAVANRTAESSPPALQASAQALTKFLENKGPININLKLRLKKIFDKIEFLIKLSSPQHDEPLSEDSVFHPNPVFLREDPVVSHVRTFSPIELVCASVLIAYHMEQRSDGELLDDVKNLRRYLRLNHKDLRINPQCWNTAWAFIGTIGTGEEPPAAHIATITNEKPAKKASKKVAIKVTKSKAGSRTKPKAKGREAAKAKPTKRDSKERSASISSLSSLSSNDERIRYSSPLFPGMVAKGLQEVETRHITTTESLFTEEQPLTKKQKTSY
jgi:hypothetical protein